MAQLTQIRVSQYLQLEKSLIDSKMSVNIRQIYDPENIKVLLCSDPNRGNCRIRFTDEAHKLYCKCSQE